MIDIILILILVSMLMDSHVVFKITKYQQSTNILFCRPSLFKFITFEFVACLLWIDAMCVFTCALLSHMLHLYGFFPSWSDLMCVVKVPISANLAPHILHSKGLFSLWITAICLLKPCFSANLASHMLHSKGISLSWKAAYVLSNHFFLPIQYHIKCIHKVWQVKLYYDLLII